MFNYFGSNNLLKEQLNKYSEKARMAYSLIFNEQQLGHLNKLEKKILIEEAFKPLRETGVQFAIDGKFDGWHPKEIYAAPKISLTNEVKKFQTYLHEYNHVVFFALQKFPASVVIDIIHHFFFQEHSFYKFYQSGFAKGKSKDEYLLAKLAGMLVAMDENTNILVTRKVMKFIQDSSYYFKSDHPEFEKGLNTLDWFLHWNENDELFIQVLKTLYQNDKALVEALQREKKFIKDFLHVFKNAKCRKVAITKFDEDGNYKRS